MSMAIHPATLRSNVSVGEHPHCCWASYSTSYPRLVRPTKISSLSHVRVALFTCDTFDLYASSDSSISLISFSSAIELSFNDENGAMEHRSGDKPTSPVWQGFCHAPCP